MTSEKAKAQIIPTAVPGLMTLTDGRYTADIKNCYHDKGSKGSINTSGKCLCNTLIYHFFELIYALASVKILTDTVEDNDRGVDRITNDSQHTSDKSISYGNSGNRIECKDNKHIMKKCKCCPFCKAVIT